MDSTLVADRTDELGVEGARDECRRRSDRWRLRFSSKVDMPKDDGDVSVNRGAEEDDASQTCRAEEDAQSQLDVGEGELRELGSARPNAPASPLWDPFGKR